MENKKETPTQKPKINVLVNEKSSYSEYITFLNHLYDVNVITFTNFLKDKFEIDLVLFTGGEDVNPDMYHEAQGKHTFCNLERDSIEEKMFFLNMHVPKLGICRGSQFLTVMSGGKLIQHVTGHAIGRTHEIILKHPFVGEIYEITSTHHQMMFPYNLDSESYTIIATSKYYMSNTYLNGKNDEIKLPKNFEECEIVFYPKTNSLAIQGHPEFAMCPKKTKDFCLNLISRKLLNK